MPPAAWQPANAPVIRFSDDDEVVLLANDTEYGLAAYFYTRDLRRAWTIAEQLEYGMVRQRLGGCAEAHTPQRARPSACCCPRIAHNRGQLCCRAACRDAAAPLTGCCSPAADRAERGGHHERGGALWRRQAERPGPRAGQVGSGRVPRGQVPVHGAQLCVIDAQSVAAKHVHVWRPAGRRSGLLLLCMYAACMACAQGCVRRAASAAACICVLQICGSAQRGRLDMVLLALWPRPRCGLSRQQPLWPPTPHPASTKQP